MKSITTILFCCVLFSFLPLQAQHSIARDWNEELLQAIRNDYARPTVHARNLFHSSIIMYDAWAIFDPVAQPVLLGNTFRGYTCSFSGVTTSVPTDFNVAKHEIISYGMFRLLQHRFQNSPNAETTQAAILERFESYGYDPTFTSTDYASGSYAALGNYLASEIIAFGLLDGSNEENDYANQHYIPVNEPLLLEVYEETNDINPDRWQPLAFDIYIDQSGNIFPANTPAFLSPEWGEVTPFALQDEDLDIINNGYDCYVYNDPGPPVYIEDFFENGIDDPYKWHFALVASWSSHLDPNDDTLIDISPASLGNVPMDDYPETFEEYKLFYDFENGGDIGTGHLLNPVTGTAYTPQFVKRADYARVLAEFWADGPDSETPPGHWFTILNYVNDHPMTVKKIGGEGPVLGDLEWDVKTYLTLGGAMHDAAVNTWGIKGYYDYVRPISALRYMAGKGQSSDASLPSYDPHGLPLIPGLIELITAGDPLAGDEGENINALKVKAWKGPDYISDPSTDVAGVDWILASRWWPYQRGTFVTPPFAGYLSGHSTFSRAAAEVMTSLTGDAFFPGGMGTFDIAQNDFLFFEQGPSEDFTLQWATYRDASDQTSLSRIWGGIHPPIDDIRGRIIGAQIGVDAYDLALEYFGGTAVLSTPEISEADISLYPNPFTDTITLNFPTTEDLEFTIYSIEGKRILNRKIQATNTTISLASLSSGMYFGQLKDGNGNNIVTKKLIKQ